MKLHPYQIVGMEHLRQHARSALFLDMGLGKTAISLSALRPEDLPALVVAPKRVAEQVWPYEASIWRPDLTVAVAAGSPAERSRALFSGTDVVAISRDNMGDLLKVHQGRANPRGMGFKTLILDELSGYKGRGTRFKQARTLTRWPTIRNVWGLTGTPSPNGLMDLWAQVFLLDEGERLGKGITAFRNRYFTAGRRLPSGVVTSWDIRPGADGRIHRLVEDICLSMDTEGRVELPPTTLNEVRVEMPKAAKALYDEFEAKLVTDLAVLGGGVVTAKNAAVLTGKLQQISAGFMYPDVLPGEKTDAHRGFTRIHQEKVKAVQEIVEGTGSPVLVFYLFKAELELLKEALPGLVFTANEKDLQRRWNAGEMPLLAAHPAQVGHGLNLQQGGHTIVWMSQPWDLEFWGQANSRLTRQGQQHPVVIHVVRTSTSIDRAIKARIEGKITVQQALRDHLERDYL